jgi:hypothetical protein
MPYPQSSIEVCWTTSESQYRLLKCADELYFGIKAELSHSSSACASLFSV